jgi:hypothetical protein
MANQGMLTLDEAMEQDRWITLPNGEVVEFIQEPQVSIEENSPSFMEYSDLSDEQKASGRYQIPEEEILRVEEAAKVAEAWKKEFQRMMKANADLQRENKKIAELEQGMLTARLEAEAERKALEAEAKAKADEAKRIADAEAKAKISKDVAKDLDEDSGRSKPVKMKNLRGEKPGFVMADGTNWWSVDEKDDYWQTKEGHKEAMNLYGQKPSWVKESTLEYNPKTGKYDSIEKEEFAEIKPKKRISL